MNRRNLVQSTIVFGVLASTSPRFATELPKTPRDYAGPFYPRGPRNQTNDLITGPPIADMLQLSGRILTPQGAPYANAIFNSWQADPNGRYKHPRDDGQDQLLDDFLYWGEATSDSDGRFTLRTYVPGSYAARPAQHIHYKVFLDDNELLTSQIYFEELGGAGGLSRSSQDAKLQTVNLSKLGEGQFESSLTVVV